MDELEGKKKRLELLQKEFEKEYKKRGNRATVSVLVTILLLIAGFLIGDKITTSLFVQRLIIIIPVLSGIVSSICLDRLSYKRIIFLENKINKITCDVEKIEKEELEKSKVQERRIARKLTKNKRKKINYVDDTLEMKIINKSKKKNK